MNCKFGHRDKEQLPNNCPYSLDRKGMGAIQKHALHIIRPTTTAPAFWDG